LPPHEQANWKVFGWSIWIIVAIGDFTCAVTGPEGTVARFFVVCFMELPLNGTILKAPRRPDAGQKTPAKGKQRMKAKLIWVAIFLGVVYLLTRSSSRPTLSIPVATDDKLSKAMLYMSCLGFSTSAAAKTLKAADGDVNKVITMAHMAVTGEVSGEPPLNERERTCLKNSGL
jgi:hypothetical protein